MPPKGSIVSHPAQAFIILAYSNYQHPAQAFIILAYSNYQHPAQAFIILAYSNYQHPAQAFIILAYSNYQHPAQAFIILAYSNYQHPAQAFIILAYSNYQHPAQAFIILAYSNYQHPAQAFIILAYSNYQLHVCHQLWDDLRLGWGQSYHKSTVALQPCEDLSKFSSLPRPPFTCFSLPVLGSGPKLGQQLPISMCTKLTTCLNSSKTLKDLKDGVNVTFITVTGDRDLKPPIEDALDNGIPVELWSWENAMAREYRQLANSHPLFQANILNSIQHKFSRTSFMSTRRDKRVNPARAIVFRGVPKGKRFLYNFYNTIARLMRLFYFTCVSCKEEGRCDLIVEFPKTKPKIVLGMLKKWN